MRPNADPNVPQLAIENNGGDPKDELKPQSTGDPLPPPQTDPTTVAIGRDNELINDNGVAKNIQDSKAADGTTTGAPNSRYYQPSVAIPVEGMSVSEPAWGWQTREYDAARLKDQRC